MTSHVMPTYGRLDVTFTHGEGAWLWDENNTRYLDALSGIAVCGLGHAHPGVHKAICDQAQNCCIHLIFTNRCARAVGRPAY